MRGVTSLDPYFLSEDEFQPALPMRGVTSLDPYFLSEDEFQPALPMRGVTSSAWTPSRRRGHFNPHSPCGE